MRRGWPLANSVPVARRQILADRRRVSISVLGIGAALALILLLQGLWDGTLEQIAAWADGSGADLFVADAGTRTSLESSVVTLEDVQTIRAIPGVRAADPVVSRFVIVDLHGRKVAASLVGHRPGGMGGPSQLAAGRGVRRPGEIVVDRVLAGEHRLEVGSAFDVTGERFEVVGLSDGTRSWMTGYVFVSHEAAERLFRAPGTTTFVLVRASDPARVADAISRRTGLQTLATAELIGNDSALYAGILQAPIKLMVAIAFAAGTMITALTVYSSVVERGREYGIVRAMGAKTTRLCRIVLGQTLVLGGLGLVAAFAIFAGATHLIGATRPRFWIELTPRAAAQVVVAAIAMALLAAVVPTRRLVRVDPASVYRGT